MEEKEQPKREEGAAMVADTAMAAPKSRESTPAKGTAKAPAPQTSFKPARSAPSTSGERHKRCRRQKSHSGQKFDHKGNKRRTQSSSGEEKNIEEQSGSGGGRNGGAAGQKTGEEQKNTDGGKQGPYGRKKKPRRRRRAGKERPFQPHQHKWKPYFKLTWAEKKALE